MPPLKAIDDELALKAVMLGGSFLYKRSKFNDNYLKGNRRGRSAPLNMVLTETGAVKAVGKVLPNLLVS